MQTDEMVTTLAQRLGLPPAEADTTLRQSLTTLARVLPDGEATDTAAQLPSELADALRAAAAQPRDGAADTELLVADLAEKLDLDGEQARRRLGASLATIRDALDEGQWVELTTVLPGDLVGLVPSS